MAKTSVLGGSWDSNSVGVRNGTVAWKHDGSWEPEWSGHVSISWHWEDFVLHTYGLQCACASNQTTCSHQLRVFWNCEQQQQEDIYYSGLFPPNLKRVLNTRTAVQIRILCHSLNLHIDNSVYIYFPTNIIINFFYLIQKLDFNSQLEGIS